MPRNIMSQLPVRCLVSLCGMANPLLSAKLTLSRCIPWISKSFLWQKEKPTSFGYYNRAMSLPFQCFIPHLQVFFVNTISSVVCRNRLQLTLRRLTLTQCAKFKTTSCLSIVPICQNMFPQAKLQESAWCGSRYLLNWRKRIKNLSMAQSKRGRVPRILK